ncbi:restriction endonuclease subunit S [Pseudoalteromonas sp. S16_S37]|uniref:restriction endonuclease subunit S n=1 Tax=Pseudoalteromonas sp. S16_S37 TaxID=2720228 RepID=UPI0016816301|nr:restriction endonuclease subunit S [Pseudoalteromonas sp. S16_S37]MBD1583429.1 restriction endonuclease subunit S [Pseudoalteromonas sp. S16_S37]
MYKVRVLQEIDDRLDAEYYNPAALSTLKKMETKGKVTTFGSLVNEGYRVVYHGTDSINGLKDSELLPFLSPTQIDANGAISFDDADKLPLYYKNRYPKGLGKAGEILVEVKGNVSKVGIVPLEFPKNLMISGSLYKATLDPKRADSHYVLAFLKSKHGQILKNRLTSNTIINYIAKDALYSIPVIEFGEKAQKYIGDKVRQAEQLRAWAKVAEMTAEELFNGCVDWSSEVLNVGKINKVSVSELDGRLDLKYNSPARLALLRHIKNKEIKTTYLNGLVDISAMIGWKGLTTEYYTSSGPWLLRGVEFRDGVIEFEKLVSVDLDKYLEQPQIHLKEGDIAFSKDGTIGKAIVIPELSNDMAAGSTIARLRPKRSTEINPYYLELALNHDFVQVQVESFATGIAQPHITQEWIAQLVIPRVQDEESIGESLKLHHLANNHSKKLIQTAKTLAEALIEGQLTEQQLIQAQQALDDGDNSFDQAILSKLSNEGYAIEGATPLFSDTEELYRLLESAAHAEAEE